MDVHAGVSETSGMLALRPDLVSPDYKKLPRQVGRSFEELREIALTPEWQGYFSSPATATAAHGRAIEAWWIEGFSDLILRAVRGEDLRAHLRVPEHIPAPLVPLFDNIFEEERAFGAKLGAWLTQRKKE